MKEYNTVKLSTTHRDCIYLESNNNVMKCTVCRLLWWSFCCWVGSRARVAVDDVSLLAFFFRSRRVSDTRRARSILHPSIPFASIVSLYSWTSWTIYLSYACAACVPGACICRKCACVLSLVCDAMTSLSVGHLNTCMCVWMCVLRDSKSPTSFLYLSPSSDWMIVGVFVKERRQPKAQYGKTAVHATWSSRVHTRDEVEKKYTQTNQLWWLATRWFSEATTTVFVWLVGPCSVFVSPPVRVLF